MIKKRKVCPKCRLLKPMSEYHKRAKSKDGRQSYCKSCTHEKAMTVWERKRAEKDNPGGLLPKGTTRECACCGGLNMSLIPRIIRCTRKKCLKAQEVFGVKPDSPPIDWTVRLYGKEPMVEGLDRKEYGSAYSEFIKDAVGG